jgi:uncharacterized membrane protein
LNRVFSSQLRKGRGLMYFAPGERLTLAVAGGGLFLVAGLAIAAAATVVLAALLFVHRRMDNGRYDHLEILLRRKGLLPAHRWSLCERDGRYREFQR